jgi:hypothetical protein
VRALLTMAGILSAHLAVANIDTELVAGGFARLVDIQHAGDGSDRLFLVLQGGEIRIYDGTQVLATAFLDISALTDPVGERGFLGLAFHPHYMANGFLYVHYNDTAGDTVVARYQVSADPNVAAHRSDARPALRQPQWRPITLRS